MAVAGQPALARRERIAHAARRAGDLAVRLHLPLVAIYAVAAAVAASYAADVNTWKVMTDELQYVRLALSFDEENTLAPRIHGSSIANYGLLYPLLIAPLYALMDAPEAFQAAHVLNGLVMASAVFPAYLIARGAGLSKWISYLAGALSVAIPWLTVTTLIFTEVAAYPAFLWAVAGMQRAMYVPGVRSDLLAIAGILLAFFARTQFVVLAPLLPLAILVHELGFRALDRPRPSPRAALAGTLRAVWEGHRTLIAVYALGGAAIAFLFPGGFTGILGSYAETARGDLLPPNVVATTELNIVLIGLGVGLVPVILAAAWAVSSLVRLPARREHALAVLTLLVVPAVAAVATSFNLRYQLGFSQERYLFYVAPLLLIGMLACLAGARRPWLAVLIAGGAVVWRLEPADLTFLDPPLFSSPSQEFYRVLDGRAYELGRLLGFHDLSHEPVILVGAVVATIALAAAVRYLPKAAVTAVVGLAVLAYGAAQTLYVFPKAVFEGTGGPLSARIPLEERDWIDENVPADAKVALSPGMVLGQEFDSRVVFWTTEFFNKRVTDTLFYEGDTNYTPFDSELLKLDERTGRMTAPSQHPYVVVPRDNVRSRFAARRRFAHPLSLLVGVEAELPYRLDWATFGVDPDRWTVDDPKVRFYADPRRETTERRVELTLELAERAPTRRYRLEGAATPVTGVLRGGDVRQEVVCVSVPRGSFTDLDIDVRRTLAPDDRMVGLQLTWIEELPLPAGGCD